MGINLPFNLTSGFYGSICATTELNFITHILHMPFIWNNWQFGFWWCFRQLGGTYNCVWHPCPKGPSIPNKISSETKFSREITWNIQHLKHTAQCNKKKKLPWNFAVGQDLCIHLLEENLHWGQPFYSQTAYPSMDHPRTLVQQCLLLHDAPGKPCGSAL